MGKFHEGEIAVQEQAGVRSLAQRVGNGIHPFISDSAAEFLQSQPFVIVASQDVSRHVWASLLTGNPGFLQVVGLTTLRVDLQSCPDDPLLHNLQTGVPLGFLAIDLAARLRLRLNGRLSQYTSKVLYIEAEEVYGNCQKYIQARALLGGGNPSKQSTPKAHTSPSPILTSDQQSWIAQSDTFFIASLHPSGGADASHRGGYPGFVHVLNEREIVFPDYSGNMMFNTLGNITVNPSAGLLFLDFETSRTLQLTGQATVIWGHDQLIAFPGAQRLVTFQIQQVSETQSDFGLRFGAPNYSRFNPR